MPDIREPQLDELRRRARRRLIGAIVLALAAAVLVPMLLESDPKPLGEDVSVKIPPIDDGKFVSRVGDKGKAEPAPAAPAKAEPKAEAKSEARPEAATPAAQPDGAAAKTLANAEQRVLAPPAKSAATPPRSASTNVASAPPARVPEVPKPAETPPKASEADKTGSYSVQLAAFIDDKGANSLAGKLKKSGYPAYTEPYETSRGTLWRVRVGPYASRDAAEGVRAKLKAEGQNGIIAAAK